MNILKPLYAIQSCLFASLEETMDPLTEKNMQLVRILGLAQLERFTGRYGGGNMGRRRKPRQAIACAFVAKALYNFPTTETTIEHLRADKNLRRLCGWEHACDVPSASTFSRAFEEFARDRLPESIHQAIIKESMEHKLVGHISRDSTAIEAREKPAKKQAGDPAAAPKPKHRRGRPRRGEQRPSPPPKRLDEQLNRTLQENVDELPSVCDIGAKRDSKGNSYHWTGYKLHLDTADGDIPVSAILTSASLHDSQAAIPLAQTTALRVTNLYDLMDAAYDAPQIDRFSRALGHVPLIDDNPRRGEKVDFAPAQQARFAQRSASERVNSALKDSHGARFVRVRGAAKVFAHLMFGVLVIAANQLFRLLE